MLEPRTPGHRHRVDRTSSVSFWAERHDRLDEHLQRIEQSENSGEGHEAVDEATEFTYRRVHRAPRDLVFECMTTPEHLCQFWGPTGTTTPIDGDHPRPASWRCVRDRDGQRRGRGPRYTMRVIYDDVTPPRAARVARPGIRGAWSPPSAFPGGGRRAQPRSSPTRRTCPQRSANARGPRRLRDEPGPVRRLSRRS